MESTATELLMPSSKKIKLDDNPSCSNSVEDGSNNPCKELIPKKASTPNSSESDQKQNNCSSDNRKKSVDDVENELENNDSNYFRCYADLSIHRVMIGDYSRTQTYRRAILTNYRLFHQKVVLDVGAGTGILSLFCAQAGAKKVYAIEASSIATEAQKVVTTNGYSDRIIVMQEKVEDVDLPEKVDIIVSEWMGYMLMYESMLPSLLYARDKWLKEDGHLFPEEVRIYIAPICDHQEYEYSVEFWRKVEDAYKVDMSALAKTAAEQMQATVHVMSVDPASIQSHASCVTTMKLATVGQNDSDCAQGTFECNCFGHAIIHGFVIWFTVHFPSNVVLSTSPYEKETHWEQSVLYVPPVAVEQDTMVSGKLWIRKGEVYHRFLDIELEYAVSSTGEKRKMKFKMKD
ncbi:protein arginine N-methyltransferase 6-like [Uloborus diversus]|uniref:protein arginine N-methyltransferase 6-like n=1 Tax=Uloborus diversus TaxID=327109 RepID=UPI00240A8103|nr:protein arginine N-methyltransferase 6-like [Uloborus diversus]